MSRTVTALYDTKAEAEEARARLAREVDIEGRAKIIDNSSQAGSSSEFGSMPLSHEDRQAYAEGVRRGGFMLCAQVDEDEECEKIVSILEQTSGVDLEDRQNSWRNEGWRPDERAQSESPERGEQRGDAARGNIVEEERIPVVEEQLRVGKRQFERGGARVRSYVEERPVEESVTLRDEHVEVERRPVNQPLSSAELEKNQLLGERTVEMRATGEAPVIGKEAQLKEEVVIQKTATERTEQIHDSVRNTKVDVNEAGDSDFQDRDGSARRNTTVN